MKRIFPLLLIILSACGNAPSGGRGGYAEPTQKITSYSALKPPYVLETVELPEINSSVRMLCSKKFSRNRSSVGYRARQANTVVLTATAASANLPPERKTSAIENAVRDAANSYGCAPVSVFSG